MRDDELRAGSEGPEEAGGAAPDAGEEELTLEERLERLGEIVSGLEAEDVELDRALALFEEGVGHIRAAEALLARAELRVEELVGEEGELRPFERDEGDEG